MISTSEILIAAAFLIVVVSGRSQPCPDICKCPMLYRADCLSLSLTHLPSDLQREIIFLNFSNNHLSMITKSVLNKNVEHLKILDLSNNKISLIQNGSMRDMKELIFLYLSGNEITSIDQNVFEYNLRLEFLKLDKNVLILPPEKPFLNIPSLKSLDIASCNIKTIPEVTFAKLQNLQELSLSHNRLLSLESGVFLPLKHLKLLYLSGNLLRVLPQNLFASLKDLEILDLSKNQLHILNLQTFASLENVDLLDLSNNKLKTLEVGVFTPMIHLKRLHLHKNILNSIKEDQFSDLNNLTVLDLSGNHLQNLHFRTVCHLDNIMYLKVSGNKLSCDCALWQLWKWSTEKNVTILSTCEESGFEFSVRGFEELRKNNSCNVTMCELKIDSEIPQVMFTPVYAYVITGFGILLVIFATFLTVWALFRYRKDICRKKNAQLSATHHSTDTMTYISRQHAEQLAQLHHQRQLELQHELHRRHQETMMRNRLRGEHSSSLKNLSENSQANHNFRHSYQEERLPSVTDDEREWFNADTLPSNNRTSVFLPNLPTPSRRDCSARRDRSSSEPRVKEYPRRDFNILDGDTSTPKRDSSVLCPIPRRARGCSMLDFLPESDAAVPEDNVENQV